MVRVLLDNGEEILYKPRSMDNEERYSEMLRWLAVETGIKQYEYTILSYPDHSWCSIVGYASCHSQNARDLFDGQGKRMGDFFACMPIELLYLKLEKLCEEDMKKQSGYIELALELTADKTELFMNKVYCPKEYNAVKANRAAKTGGVKRNIELLTERILQNAVWNREHNEVSWCTVQFSNVNRKNWIIRSMNLYLYDGLSGMLLLMYHLKDIDRRRKIAEIYESLKKQMFQYTDSGLLSLENLQTRDPGMYEGEGSIVYTYLLLYKGGAENEYLDYAKRHARIVERLIEEDTKYDLLSGNAGAVQVLLMLYEVIPDKAYLETAEKAMDVLDKASEKQKHGIGWTTEKGQPPMAGAAHGNSGVLTALLHLWHLTSKDKYAQLAEEVWAYEEDLYNPEINNWTDVRSGQQDVDNIGAMAWCHGAPGVLYSRIKGYEHVKDLKWKKRLEKDMWRAYRKLKEYWRRDSWCLCHGICGNLWILEKASEILGEEKAMCSDYPVWDEVHLLPQEKENPGLLNGYGGILLYLIQNQNAVLER